MGIDNLFPILSLNQKSEVRRSQAHVASQAQSVTRLIHTVSSISLGVDFRTSCGILLSANSKMFSAAFLSLEA